MDMNETVDPHKTEVANDTYSVRMLEEDSWERMIGGMKRASQGCRHLVFWRQEPMMDVMADTLDKIRVAMTRKAKRGKPSDADPTLRARGMEKMLAIECYEMVYNGLTDAAACARQFAGAHRMDADWSLYALNLEKLRDKASLMIRSHKFRRSGLILPN